MSLSRRVIVEVALTATASVVLPAWGQAGAQDPGPRSGDVLVAVGNAAAAALRADDIRAGAPPVLAWPMDPVTRRVRNQRLFNQVLLLRLPQRGDVTSDDSLLAFSAICQHAACVVSGWLPESCLLLCPCHGSRYDPANAGAVVAGPAPLPLPSLPLQVVQGEIVAAGPFSAHVGGHTGRTD